MLIDNFDQRNAYTLHNAYLRYNKVCQIAQEISPYSYICCTSTRQLTFGTIYSKNKNLLSFLALLKCLCQ